MIGREHPEWLWFAGLRVRCPQCGATPQVECDASRLRQRYERSAHLPGNKHLRLHARRVDEGVRQHGGGGGA